MPAFSASTWRMNSNSASPITGPVRPAARSATLSAAEGDMGRRTTAGRVARVRRAAVTRYAPGAHAACDAPRPVAPPSAVGRSGDRRDSRHVAADELIDVEEHHHAPRHRGQTCNEFRADLRTELRSRLYVALRHVDDIRNTVDDHANVAPADRRLDRQH